MTRILLVWNIVVTLLLIGSFFSGCASIDPEFSNLSAQVKSNRAAIETLADALNQDRALINTNAAAIQEIRLYVQTALSQLQSVPK